MGLHSLTPVTPEWEKDPWNHYGNQVARIRAYVETHYEFASPLHGYQKAIALADLLATALDVDHKRAIDEKDPARYLYQAAAWDAWRVLNLLEKYEPRMAVVTALADLRRHITAIDEHVRNGSK